MSPELKRLFKTIELSSLDFIKSDHCGECGGEGFIDVTFTMNEMGEKETVSEQCEECERLHKLELYADRMMATDSGSIVMAQAKLVYEKDEYMNKGVTKEPCRCRYCREWTSSQETLERQLESQRFDYIDEREAREK